MAENQKLSILIVDDREENLASMVQLLAREDLEILTAQSGNEALGLMLENDLALVLLDVQMPGMDGFEVAQLMRHNVRTRRIPIIFVTAINKERRHIFTGFEAGAVDYMFKPVDPFIIRSKVQVFLEIKRNELEREQLVADLNMANRQLKEISERKSDFLSAASHELRTPLTIIKEYCGLVRDGVVGEVSSEQEKCMDAALRNCNRLADLVNDLLDLDSIESGHLAFRRNAVDLKQLLSDSLHDFETRCQAAGQELVLELPGDLPAALGDGQMVTQVLVNLLGNALKFTPEGGRITVRGMETPAGLRVEVSDTGPGIPAEDRAKVFQKFTQLSRKDGPGAKGTGLGLAISHKIIELLDGQMGLDSVPGVGATFHFTLPAYDTGMQLKALVADGSRRGFGPSQDWTLVLLQEQNPASDLPAWLDDLVEGVARVEDDLVSEIQIAGRAAKVILMQASRDGALAFLSRLDQMSAREGEPGGPMQFALLEITPENRNSFTGDLDGLEFSDLALDQESKGKSYV